MYKKGYAQWVGIVILVFVVLVATQYKIEKTELEVSIFDDKIQNASIRIESIPLFKAITKTPELQGTYRLYLEITSETTKETILISAKDRIGEGLFSFDMTKPKFDDSWKVFISLKKYDRFGNLIEKDKYCSKIIWERNNVKEERKIYC